MNDETKSEWLTLDSGSLAYRVRAASVEATGVSRNATGGVIEVVIFLHSASIRIAGDRAQAAYATLRECLPDAT